jgi:hypothetical protein
MNFVMLNISILLTFSFHFIKIKFQEKKRAQSVRQNMEPAVRKNIYPELIKNINIVRRIS